MRLGRVERRKKDLLSRGRVQLVVVAVQVLKGEGSLGQVWSTLRVVQKNENCSDTRRPDALPVPLDLPLSRFGRGAVGVETGEEFLWERGKRSSETRAFHDSEVGRGRRGKGKSWKEKPTKREGPSRN